MCKKKIAPDLGSNPHTAPRIQKEVLTPPPDPPPPPPPQKGVGTPPPPLWALASEDLAVFTLFSDTCKISKITSQRLLDQSQAGVYRGKRHIPPHFEIPYPKGLNCYFNPL